MNNELQQHLDSLARDDCYRVDAVLKDGKLESTERVFFVGKNGAEQGPYIRKRFDCESGLGSAYRRILSAQYSGVRFLHLSRIIDCYNTGEQDIVVMEYVPGLVLSDAVFSCDSRIEFTQRIFPQICEAVQELHERFNPPLIHRDIKPSNFIVSGDEVFIIDFGIARTFDESASGDTNHFGTRAYAPPEQFGYGQTDVRSDVYALGMLLFYCFTGNVATNVDRTNNFVNEKIPHEFQGVINRACSFSPDDRYQTVAELLEAFENAIYMYHFQENNSNGLPERAVSVGCAGSPENAVSPGHVTSIRYSVSPERVAEQTLETKQTIESFQGVGSLPSKTQLQESNAPKQKMSVRSLLTNKVNQLSNAVPKGIGIAWNVILFLVWLLIVSVCVYLCFNPDPTTASFVHPFWFRVVEYPLFMGVSTTGICYELADRRRVRKKFNKLRKFSLVWEFLIVAVALPLLLAIAMTAIGMAAGIQF